MELIESLEKILKEEKQLAQDSPKKMERLWRQGRISGMRKFLKKIKEK